MMRSSIDVLLWNELQILFEKSSNLDDEELCKLTAQVCAGDPVEVEQ